MRSIPRIAPPSPGVQCTIEIIFEIPCPAGVSAHQGGHRRHWRPGHKFVAMAPLISASRTSCRATFPAPTDARDSRQIPHAVRSTLSASSMSPLPFRRFGLPISVDGICRPPHGRASMIGARSLHSSRAEILGGRAEFLGGRAQFLPRRPHDSRRGVGWYWPRTGQESRSAGSLHGC